MKKIFSALAIAVMLFTVSLSVSAATPSLALNSSSTTFNSAETLNIKVNLTESVSLKSLGLTVEFDKNVFTIVSGSWKVKNTFMSDAFGSIVPNNAVMLMKKETAISGEIFEFSLRVNDSVGESNSKITVKPVAKNNNGDVALSAASFEVKINPHLSGESLPSETTSNNGNSSAVSSSGYTSSIGNIVSQSSPTTQPSGSSFESVLNGNSFEKTSSAVSNDVSLDKTDNDNTVFSNDENEKESKPWMIVAIVICAILGLTVIGVVIIVALNRKSRS